MAIVGKNYVVLTTNGIHTQSQTNITFNEAVPSSGFDFMLVVDSPFEIMQATAYVSTYVLTVTRRAESTTNVVDIPSGTTVVCELTHETLDDVYGQLLDFQKIISGNETTASRTGRTPDINEITLDTNLDQMFIGVDDTPNTWEELCLEDHADLDPTSLSNSTEHTQYYTDARGDTWHGNLPKEHLDTLDHDHLTVPVANMRDLSSEPADTTEGGVYYNTTSFSIYYYDGASWQQYSTVPTSAIIFRDDGSCPSGWTEKTAWNGYYLKGDDTGVWAGGSGGASSHVHTLTDVPQHAHTTPARGITVTAVGDHTHTHSAVLYSSGGGNINKFSDKNAGSSTTSSGAHTHTLTVPTHDTDNSGISDAETQSTTSEPKYVELTICEKD